MFPGIEYIKTCLNGIRSKFDKLAQDTNGKLQASTADWNQNDPDALDYVKGRTHYEANGKVVQLPPKFLPSPTSNTAGAIKADVAKTTDTQPVRLGTDGKLYASGIPVFTTSGTGREYTAHVPEITNLVKGMLVVMIPHTDSASQYPELIINRGLSKNITRPVSTGGESTFISLPNLKSGIPYLLIYTGSQWLSINNVRPDALDLTNFVTPSNGGTGLTSLTKGSYIIGNGLSSVEQKTPSEVLADIGAIPVPTTASVGQVLAVKAVDKNGKPTEWALATLPDKLPNPNALTFTGAVTGSYDGSAPLSVEIPSGGGGGGGSSGGSGKAKSQILIDQEITELTASLSVTMEHDFHNLTAIISYGSAGAALTAGSDGTAVASKIGLLIDTTSFGFNSRKVAQINTSTGTWKTMMCGAEWSDDLSVFKLGFTVEIAVGANSQYNFLFGGPTAMYGTVAPGDVDNAPRTGKTANIVVNGAYLNVGTRVVLWGEYYE